MQLNVKKIQLLMRRQLMTQQDLAKISGLRRNAIGNALIKGACSDKIAERIALALGVDTKDICADAMPNSMVPPNPYWERICAMADRQRAKGISTYGQGLESNPADMLKRIEYLQEELIDGLMYCEWIKDELKKMEDSKNGNLSEQN